MPVIEHVEVATGGYPSLAVRNSKNIFAIMSSGPDYVMLYSEATLKKLVNHMFAKEDVEFTPDGDKETSRTIVHKSDETKTLKDRVFYGATDVKKN